MHTRMLYEWYVALFQVNEWCIWCMDCFKCAMTCNHLSVIMISIYLSINMTCIASWIVFYLQCAVDLWLICARNMWYSLNGVTKLSSVPNEWLFHPLSGWVDYVCKHALWAALCTLMSYMHVVIRVTFITNTRVDLWLFFKILVFKTSHEEGNFGFKQRLLWKMGMIYIFKRWILNMWLKEKG